VGSIFGLVGAIRLHAGWLNIFCITLVALIVLDIIYLIVAAVNGYGAGDFLWNIVVICLLAVTLLFASQLRNAVAGATVLF